MRFFVPTRKETEHLHQAALLAWCAVNAHNLPGLEWIFAIPNGGKRPMPVARKLKAEGVKPGVPDLMLPVPRRGYHGLFIEMKSEVGRVQKEQQAWLDALALQGYRSCVCRGVDQAIEAITWYLR